MKSLYVDVPGGRYPIWIGADIVDRIPGWFRSVGSLPSSCHLVSDSNVFPLHGSRVFAILKELGVPVSRTVVPAGERSKSIRQMERIWRATVRAGLDRRSLVVALGGGVVGDLGGFVAASLLRGVDFLQIPTSLLAMVDSSVGGKTGINLPEGKNLVGAFYQPRAVWIDLRFLETLPVREFRCGLAEIAKAGAIRDGKFFRFLEENAKEIATGKSPRLERVIRSSCRIKSDVVNADEREAGLRMILNFGHTLGHGIEAAAGYGKLLHGEAVSIGMAFASRLGTALGYASGEAGDRIRALLRDLRLPTRLPPRCRVSAGRVLDAMMRDKKKGRKGPRWVLVPKIGTARIHEDIPWDAVKLSVEQFLGGGAS